MSKSERTVSVVVVAVLVTAVAHGWARQGIGPTVMMFHGGSLKQPVFVTGADTSTFGDLLRHAQMRAQAMGSRAFVDVALFWGPRDDPARNGVREITRLKPEMAWQHGRFYPAVAGQPAVLLTTALTKNAQNLPVPVDASPFVSGGAVPASATPLLERLGLSRPR
jgi:hypothetical protein